MANTGPLIYIVVGYDDEHLATGRRCRRGLSRGDGGTRSRGNTELLRLYSFVALPSWNMRVKTQHLWPDSSCHRVTSPSKLSFISDFAMSRILAVFKDS